MKKDSLVRLEGNVLVMTVGKKVTKYLVEDIAPDPDVAYPAFRLTKMVNDDRSVFYDVSVDRLGMRCTCGDQHWRRDKNNTFCKHLRAAQAVGLLPLPDDPNERTGSD